MIIVLAGLDEVDSVFADFANAIETLIRTGRSSKLVLGNNTECTYQYEISGHTSKGY